MLGYRKIRQKDTRSKVKNIEQLKDILVIRSLKADNKKPIAEWHQSFGLSTQRF